MLHQTTAQLITYLGQWGWRKPSKCDHVLTRHSVPEPPFLPSGCILRAVTSHSDSVAFHRSQVTFVTLHASQICISVVSTYQSSLLMSRTSISHSIVQRHMSSRVMCAWVFTKDKQSQRVRYLSRAAPGKFIIKNAEN